MHQPQDMHKKAIGIAIFSVFLVYVIVAVAGILALGEANLISAPNLYEALDIFMTK